VLAGFTTAVHLSVAELAPRRIFVHAGVVGWKGRAIMLPGRTMAGKTTLVAELVKAGATYYSDEFAVLDAEGRVHAFPKPLSLRNGSSSTQRDVSIEELGGKAGTKPLPVGLVVMSQYKEGARWRPRSLTPDLGALALLSNTIAARRVPERALSVVEQIVSRARVVRGKRGEAALAASNILKTLEALD
jgi:hypothetical protein